MTMNMQKKNKIILFDIDYTVFDMGLFRESNLEKYEVYEEVHDTLTQLKEIADLGIFSEGELAFQRRKLYETNIENYFLEEHIHIVKQKIDVIKHILEKYRTKGKLFLVDDKLTVLISAKQYLPSVITIWVKRGFYAMNQQPIEGFTPDAVVENLREIIPIIDKA